MKKVINLCTLFLAFLLIFSLNISSVEAEKSYRIDNYIVDMEVNDSGDFIITEEIEYNFLEGEFSSAYREIPGRGFSSLDFVSISGLGNSVVDYNISEGSELEIDWEYPSSSDKAIFKIKYIGRDGLISNDGRNIIDWQAVGTEWDVPIKNTEIRISLANVPSDTKFNTGGEPVRQSGRNLFFQKQNINPGEGWRVSFNFREQIAMPEKTSLADYSFWIIAFIIIALILVIYRVIASYRLMKTDSNSSELNADELSQYNELSFTEKLLLHDYSGSKGARMVAALIFHLAQMSLIKLKIEVKDKFFGGEKAVIKVAKVDEMDDNDKNENIERYNPLFKEIKDGDKKLEKVISKASIWKKIVDNFEDTKIVKEWGSDYRKAIKKRSLYSAIFLIVISIGFFLDFVISERVITFLPAIFAGILAIGEFIRYAVIVPLDDTAIKMREQIDNELKQRREKLEELVENDSLAALELILNNLSWLLVDNKMTGSKFKKYRKKIENNLSKEEAESLNVPKWLALDGLEGALEAIEVVEYTMTAVYAVVASTAATSGGAAGGGAGGGGGGAA